MLSILLGVGYCIFTDNCQNQAGATPPATPPSATVTPPARQLRPSPQPAVACFAQAYRFSSGPEATRQFLSTLTTAQDPDVREAARQALQLALLQ